MTDVSLTDARQKALDAQKAIQDAQQQLAESIKVALSDCFKPIFEKYPFVAAISWTQYTPYFNDGDPCTFSSCFPEVSVNTAADVESGTLGDYEPGEDYQRFYNEDIYGDYNPETRTYDKSPNPEYRPEAVEAANEAIEIAKTLVGDDRSSYGEVSVFDGALQAAFGDHVQVVVTPDEIVVDEYYHD